MGSAPPEPSYLIIGAGCFGASTALYLSQTRPSTKITLVDSAPFPNPSAAAHDLNKIIRADYPDLLYMKLALEAQEQWRNDPIYSPYYHESGMLFAEDFGMGRDALQNYKTLLGDKCPATMLKPEDARERFEGVFKDAEWSGVKQNFYNPRSGWGEADKALGNVIQNAVDNGVEYIADRVKTIVIDELTGTTKGVMTQSGRSINADHIVLCTGAYTACLIADSAPHNTRIQVDGRMVAAAAVTCYARLPEERRERFMNVPVMFNGLDHTHGKSSPSQECVRAAKRSSHCLGESIPPTSEGLLKFTFELSFTNKIPHEASGQIISVPPSRLTQSTWSQDVPQSYKDEVRTVMKHVYGKELAGIEPENYRMCW